jgi:putative Ig domain-containing protein
MPRRLFVALMAASLPVLLVAQIPGPNVNIVTGTSFPGGDPFLQKQNEPSIAVSTRNPCHLLAGGNDYRAVALKGLPADREVGDAWVGLYKSINCGQTWFSDLVPGYLQDQSAAGVQSPVKGLSAGADSTVRAGLAGQFYYSFIAFNRGSNVGKVAVARYVDNNNKEGFDTIQYLGTTEWARGSAGQFLDKPFMAVTKGTGTCTLNGQTVPASVVHVAWTEFVGNGDQNIRTKVYYARSSNCGQTLDGPATKLSEGFPVNQAATIAVDSISGAIYVAWRQFLAGNNGGVDGILIAKSVDGGKTFTKAFQVPIPGYVPFDQGTTTISFRTNAFPSMTFDHLGNLYLAVATRGRADNNLLSRVVVLTSKDGTLWSLPQLVDPVGTGEGGHQIMPAITYAGGELHLLWYDFRDTAAGDVAKEQQFTPEAFPIRQTIEVRGARGVPDANGVSIWTTYGVLQPVTPAPSTLRISQYQTGIYKDSQANDDGVLRFLQFNRPNLRLYGGGTLPFIGDFIDIAGLNFAPKRTATGQDWLPNTPINFPGPEGLRGGRTFHAVWTDNRDAKHSAGNAELSYTAPRSPALTQFFSPGSPPECVPGLDTTRNANIYTSRITPGLVVAVPGNAKPTGSIQRAFGVNVQNATGKQREFQLTIVPPSSNVVASFAQTGQPLLQIRAFVPGKSSIVRTVYVTSMEKYPQVQVNVTEVNTPPGDTALNASALLNPDIQNPDIQNPDIQNKELHNPDIQNPDIQNPDIQNPDIQNPDIQNPDIQNPDIQNPDIQNPDIQNPDIQNPDIQNPDIQNPDIQNPDIQNGSITDVSFEMTNNGNTTSGFQVDAEVGGTTSPYLFQLIGRRVYRTPTAKDCGLREAGINQILFNIPNPDITTATFQPNDPSDKNATILLNPGEKLKITLRVIDKSILQGGPPDGIQPFCPLPSKYCSQITHRVTIAIKAQAPNTGETEPASAVSSTSTLSITTAAIPPQILPNSYNVTLQAAGGVGNLTWGCAAPCGLPSGISISTAFGTLSGIATTAGNFPFTATVTDGSQTATRSYTLQVKPTEPFMSFVVPPTVIVPVLETFNVVVRVMQFDGATESIIPVPNTPVNLALADNLNGALLNPASPTATTDTNGLASFVISVDRQHEGLRLVAYRPAAGGILSTPFDVAPTFVVTNTNDTGPGSLRNAMTAVNDSDGSGNISFNIPGAGTHVIAPATALPVIGVPVRIDGTTQPGTGSTPTIVINGASVPAGDPVSPAGIDAHGGTSLIRGLNIINFPGPGIRLADQGGSFIELNWLGVTGPTGTTAAGNGEGLSIENAANNVIGGRILDQGNLIGGNDLNGVAIHGSDSTNNLIRGNVIGFKLDSSRGAPNVENGVYITDGADGNLVSGLFDRTEVNEITRNVTNGVKIDGETTSGNTVRYNIIDGNGALGIELASFANDSQAAPALTSAIIGTGGAVTISGSLTSTPNTVFEVNLFHSPSCDGSGSGEGRTPFGSMSVFTGAGGTSTFSGAFGGLPSTGVITAIAVHPNGNSSQFSNCVTITTPEP